MSYYWSPHDVIQCGSHRTVAPGLMTRLLPVTLLSGFLGSGKTTLLKHILENKQGLKCAVIVNDMAAINIDASLVENASILQKEEKLVKMQNGCICCTLRGDLLTEIARLSESGLYDYLVIESTGISEPMQVAETFGMTSAELEQLAPVNDNGLPDEALKAIDGLARLDTCVTVVDTSSLMTYFENSRFLGQQFDNVDEGDERTVVDLLCDQLEFADVVLLNKVDIATPKQVAACEGLLKKLNPKAQVIKTTYSKVDVKRILDTGLFDYEKAAMSPGWLLSLKEPHTPETEEYGIGSFVYRARKPFHPERLHDLFYDHFVTIEHPDLQEMPGDEHEHDEMEMEEEPVEEPEEEMEDEEMEDEEMHLTDADIEERRVSKQKSMFKGLLRSKGFFWLANRPCSMGEMSQAGLMLTVTNGGNWFVDLPKDMWPNDPKAHKAIMEDFEGKTGDKRQELIFIGQMTAQEKQSIREALDKCLVTDEDMAIPFEEWEDPWEEWSYFDYEDEIVQ